MMIKSIFHGRRTKSLKETEAELSILKPLNLKRTEKKMQRQLWNLFLKVPDHNFKRFRKYFQYVVINRRIKGNRDGWPGLSYKAPGNKTIFHTGRCLCAHDNHLIKSSSEIWNKNKEPWKCTAVQLAFEEEKYAQINPLSGADHEL